MPKKTDKTIEPINAKFDDVAKELVKAGGKKSNKNTALLPIPGSKSDAILQGELNLQIQKQVEIDGLGMGVLTDGTPFLTGRGLSRLCGAHSSRISEMSADWGSESPKSMAFKVKQILPDRGLLIPEHPCRPMFTSC